MKKPVTPAELGGEEQRPDVSRALSVSDWRAGQSTQVTDNIICETAVALVYNGISHVVMMATPDHVEDFALGFSLTEGILENPSQLYDVSVTSRGGDPVVGSKDIGSTEVKGIEVAMEISSERFAMLKEARRNLTGRTGCGLCGAESLEQAIRQPKPVTGNHQFQHYAIERAVAQLEAHQPLQSLTGAVHGAALCDRAGNIKLVREDVGRHNALDKLFGALCRQQNQLLNTGLLSDHFILISSRASYEMVVKAAVMGVEMLVAVSAATQLAVDLAVQVNLTLVGFARPGRHMVYSHAQRIVN
ncbi:MAG: formate dehydrogenase accessory sulfurtransferase FdhD [Gammaproteobacteria bacterium]|nr:MAG: formate dehydrogenase accessory sulfurtransferase FdhD [Gammaproteobacteria bacterium]RLA52146.1 MAG: formate dehydrogenase accessory sulfurtransferase FdhD [Gammaproteobacteria bacterium]